MDKIISKFQVKYKMIWLQLNENKSNSLRLRDNLTVTQIHFIQSMIATVSLFYVFSHSYLIWSVWST